MASREQQIARLRRRLEAVPKSVKIAVEAAVDSAADDLVATARRLAPHDDGDLQDSIRKEVGDHDLARTVKAGGPTTTRPVREGASATYDYAFAQEFGTQKMPANPFFFSAYRLLRKQIVSRIKRAGSKAIKEHANG